MLSWRRGRGRAADSSLSLPSDRYPCGGGADRAGGQREEGAVPRPMGHEERGRQTGRGRRRRHSGDRTGRELRLQYARLRYARFADPGARDRRAGRFRRDPFGAAAGRAGDVLGRRARVRRNIGAGGGRRWRRRRFHRGPSGPRPRAVRRADHGGAEGVRGAGRRAAGLRPARQAPCFARFMKPCHTTVAGTRYFKNRTAKTLSMDKYLFSYAAAGDPALKRSLIRLVERATGQPKLKRMYVENQRFPRAGESFWQAAVRSLALDVRYDADALAAAPKTGPVVFVAHHPYAVLDGIVMSWLASKVRGDFLVLTHIVLTRAP